MNAKELLREQPDLTEYFEVSDGESFVSEEHAKAHADHFKRKYEKVTVPLKEEKPKDTVDTLLDALIERAKARDNQEEAPETGKVTTDPDDLEEEEEEDEELKIPLKDVVSNASEVADTGQVAKEPKIIEGAKDEVDKSVNATPVVAEAPKRNNRRSADQS